MALQIIGAGLGRTGTASTKVAIEQLGIGLCYHMGEVIADPSRMAGWVNAARAEPDWDAIFDGYAACVDYPGASFWRQLADYYPDAKVLLNVRDPAKWFESVNETILSTELIEAGQGTPQYDFLNETVYKTMDGRMGDRDFMIDHFNRHVEAVKDAIPPERLLVFEVKQGWEPLCAFLGVPVPDRPFPRVNSREETKAILSTLKQAKEWGTSGGMENVAKKIFEE